MNSKSLQILMAMVFVLAGWGNAGPVSGRATLHSQFTRIPIQIDGVAEDTWRIAKPARIGIAMDSSLKALLRTARPMATCARCGTVHCCTCLSM